MVSVDVTVYLLLAWQIGLDGCVFFNLQPIQLLLASASKVDLTAHGTRCFTAKVVLGWNVTGVTRKVVSVPSVGSVVGSMSPPSSII